MEYFDGRRSRARRDELSASLAVHHERLIATWQGFTTEQWEHESRNTEWTVHQTVRHQTGGADVLPGAPEELSFLASHFNS